MEEDTADSTVVLRCVKEAGKLRIKIVSPGYSQSANCQFPRNIRAEGREYAVPSRDIVMADTAGKFFYRIKKNNIKVVEKGPSVVLPIAGLKVYGDEDLRTCGICFSDVDDDPSIRFVILVRCGHYALCSGCANHCQLSGKGCPLCRAPIEQIITKDQLQ